MHVITRKRLNELAERYPDATSSLARWYAMMKTSHKSNRESMRRDYNFSPSVRGKYARCYAQGRNVVVLEADVARVFSDSKAVNVSLRKIIREKASAR
jgi:mRNA-degrading endonuclease HigB of HigAB toxin-antitoxin module